MNKAVISLSGGLDSTTVLSWLLNKGYTQIVCVAFKYGSQHNARELKSAKTVFDYYRTIYPSVEGYDLQYREIDITDIFRSMQTVFLTLGANIPEGQYDDENMKLTVVPGRNMVFLSVLAAIAESENIDKIAIGIHKGDHAIYPDCRTEFFKAMDSAVYLGTDKKVSICAPFADKTKADIVKYGLANGVPYRLTRTCYKSGEFACGVCGSCRERLEAFSLNDATDPITYVKKGDKLWALLNGK